MPLLAPDLACSENVCPLLGLLGTSPVRWPPGGTLKELLGVGDGDEDDEEPELHPATSRAIATATVGALIEPWETKERMS